MTTQFPSEDYNLLKPDYASQEAWADFLSFIGNGEWTFSEIQDSWKWFWLGYVSGSK